MKDLGTWIRAGITLLLLVLAGWWLVVVFRAIDLAPSKDASGNVLVDEYQRAKDILLVVLPLLTTALGYWFGAAGKDKAESRADVAETRADQTQKQLKGVLDSTQETDLLAKAKEKYPEAFAG